MTQKETIELFEIIKSDNLSSFGQKVAKYKKLFSVSFGRFPLLSVCYMYSSKKILKSFEKKLLENNTYNQVYEPYQLYLDFKIKSGKSLRLYATKNEIISPTEMLAILGRDSKVKRQFNKNKIASSSPTDGNVLNDDNKTRIKVAKIYDFHNQKVKFVGDNIKISPKPWSRHQRFVAMLASLIFLLVVGLSGGAAAIYISHFGLGTSTNPLKIYNASQFVQLANRKNTYALIEKDVVLTSATTLGDFSGTIYGNGKTITIEAKSPRNLFESFSGSIKDLNIKYPNIELATTTSLSLFAKKNSGNVENVNVVCNASVAFEINTETLYFCGLAQTNSGNLTNCSVLMQANLSSDATSDCYASGFVGINEGKITNCTLNETSSVSARNVSLAGFAVLNNRGCEISNCNNYANLSENSNLSNLTQAVAGISIINYGTLSQCQNHGDLKIEDTREATSSTTVYVGGVCVENYTTISHCKNEADIAVSTQNKRVYAGGICAHSPNYNNPEISNCGTKGNINIKKESETSYVICGGIVGYMEGTINKCYSQTTFTNGYDKDNLFYIGLVVGESAVRIILSFSLQYYVNLNISSTYCLETENVERPLASNYEDYTTFNPDVYVCSQAELANSDVYW